MSEQIIPTEEMLCSVTFQISIDGDIEISVAWDEAARPVDMFAELFFNLTNGQINEHIIKSLLEIIRSTPETSDFLLAMLSQWKEKVADKEEPLISPTQVFGITNKK